MQQHSTNKYAYDYIIAGAGCAGLSLLLHMQQHSFFKEKKILLIDSDDKKKNDRTWCFWETTPGLFEPIVYMQWNQINFFSGSFSGRWDIAPYTYKMIRGRDFYQYVFNQISSWQNVTFLQEKIENLNNENGYGVVQTVSQKYRAQYVFSSILFDTDFLKAEGSLLQHFKGWTIETENETFNSSIATFMDFRLCPPEENVFVYVLPLTSRTALVEYTVFSPSLLPDEEYDNGLKNYISQFLNIGNYVIKEEEFGVIPMSTFTFAPDELAVIHIGTAGGQTKSSSGYTFRFIQKHSVAIVKALMNKEHPGIKSPLSRKRFKWYDNTLLRVLYSKKLTSTQIFSDLFRQNKPQQILRFLDNETTLIEELKIMSSVPSRIFFMAAWKQFLRFKY